MKKGCQINMYNLLTYKNKDSTRDKVLQIEGSNLSLVLNEKGLRL
jgi:hypothetical protein